MYKSDKFLIAILVLGFLSFLPLTHATYGINMEAHVCEDGRFEVYSMNYGIVHCGDFCTNTCKFCSNDCLTVESYDSSGKKIATCKYRYKSIMFYDTLAGGGAKEEDCGEPSIGIPLPNNKSYAWITWNDHKVYISMENLSNWKVPEFKGKKRKTFLPPELEPENMKEEDIIEDKLRENREMFRSISWLGTIPGILWITTGILGFVLMFKRKPAKEASKGVIKTYLITRPLSTGLLIAGLIIASFQGKYLVYGSPLITVLASFVAKWLIDGIIIPAFILKKLKMESESEFGSLAIYSWLVYLEVSIFLSFLWIERYYLTYFFPFDFNWSTVLFEITSYKMAFEFFCLPAIGNALLTAFPYLATPLIIGGLALFLHHGKSHKEKGKKRGKKKSKKGRKTKHSRKGKRHH